MEEYESNEALKLESLKARAAKAKSDIATSDTVDGESYFDALEAGQHAEGVMSFQYESHFIYFMLPENQLVVLGALHKRMAPNLHLDGRDRG